MKDEELMQSEEKAQIGTASKIELDAPAGFVDRILKEEKEAGYTPMRVKFPVTTGCPVCSIQEGWFRTGITRKRLSDRSVTLWAIVRLCEGCIGNNEAEDKLIGMLTED
jgi:hypothetical protein